MKNKNPDKRKRITTYSQSSTDSTDRKTMTKEVIKPKVVKKIETEWFGANDKKGWTTLSTYTKKKSKETPKVSKQSFKTISRNYPTGDVYDSSYKQITRKPTEKKEGSVKTIIKGNSPSRTKVVIPKKKKM